MDTRSFGVEIECLVEQTDHHGMARLLTNRGVPCEFMGYTKAIVPHWKIVTDSSLSGGRTGTGMELVSPILSGEEGLQSITKLCSVLDEVDAQVNSTCGLHVHVGAADLNNQEVGRIFHRYALFEEEIDQFISKSRRASNNDKCVSLRRYLDPVRFDSTISSQGFSGISTIREMITTRDVKVNPHSFRNYGTLEFRHHQGTVDSNKINNWIRFVLDFVQESKRRAAQGSGQLPFHKLRSNSKTRQLAELLASEQARGYRGHGLSRRAIATLLDWREDSISTAFLELIRQGFPLVNWKRVGSRRLFWRIFPDQLTREPDSLMSGISEEVVRYLANRAQHFRDLEPVQRRSHSIPRERMWTPSTGGN